MPPESERTGLPLLERHHDGGEDYAVRPDQPAESAAIFRKLIGLSRAAAWRIVGGLSRPSKMPCYAWGIPAQSCQVGAKLVEVEESVCRQCYAFRGFFRTHRVQAAYQRRFDRCDHPRWVEAMVKLIYWQTAESGEPYFRWFDSGDLQSVAMLRDIAAVARLTPEIQHWLPTREYRYLAEYLRSETPPPNLTIRVSAPLINGPTPRQFGLPVSSIHRTTPGPDAFPCPAYSHEPAFCGTCRACWDQSVTNVSYRLH